MRSALLLAAVLAVAAPPARAADTTLPALLRLVPEPPAGVLQSGHVVLAYARADLLAGQRGPTAQAGSTRIAAVNEAAPMAFSNMPVGQAGAWPAVSGFDFDAIEALLVLETGAMPRGIRVLAGARMPALAALAGPLAARGFAPRRIAGQDVLARGADDAFNPQHRAEGDALGGSIALSLRYAVPAPGVLLATRTDAMMAASLAPGRRFAEVPEMRALAETSAGGQGARDLAQAMVFAPTLPGPPAVLSEAPEAAARRLAAEMRDADTLPGPTPWIFAMLSERRDAQGIVTRLAVAYRQRAAADAAAAAMAARLAAMRPPPGLEAARHAVVDTGADDVFVALIEARQPPGTADTLMRLVVARHFGGEATPMTIGALPRAAFAR
ncbi:hypothetical protein J5Y09_02290 [Roseomonas sp. PWR1]|uniref:NitT/TauT family transport system substrate-binding protein n=1 Tax=Roseomonas nitratireducens TaxID=2820810 RepID=A0ABS4AMZ2_9PROT|nr:hypothetical protein [Neoroseomonas nitratireducens]MBP0462729.1 hypothetical protein [Neoroseomonas nitratireducens]